VFGASVGRARRSPSLVLSAESLAAYGVFSVPGHVWRAMQRLGAWIEPVLVDEWSRIVRGYAERRGGAPAPGEIEGALAWIEPVRDVRIAREAALAQMAAGRPLRCVWSDRPLTPATLDVDHCLPWSAWPCGDLWNLMPAHRVVNQHQKRDRLPSAGTLAAARGVVVAWWDDAWRGGEALGARFAREVDAALPVAGTAASEEVFAALEWRRLRLRQDQQLAEWTARRGG